MKTLLIATAALEASAGILLALAPALPIWLLLGTVPDSPAVIVFARLAGLALLSLGVACWLASGDADSRAARGVVTAMLLYNVTAVALFLVTRFGPRLAGMALWPAVVVHIVFGGWCIACLRQSSLSAPARGAAVP